MKTEIEFRRAEPETAPRSRPPQSSTERTGIDASHGTLHSVTKLDETIFKPLGRLQRQWDVTVTSCYERNAISDKYRNDANDELVDRLRIKKKGDVFTSAHQPDIFAVAFSKSIHEHTPPGSHFRKQAAAPPK